MAEIESKPRKNKHGLPRAIPEKIRREVRQRCGFGCVICGGGIVQYEHVEPLFVDALEHKAECIALLCPGCHANVTSNFWSKQKVKDAMLKPESLQKGFAGHGFDFGGSSPVINIGGLTFSNCNQIIRVFSRDILRVDPPEAEGGAYRVSAVFFDDEGKGTVTIKENEWIASSSSWDVEVGGGSITVRNKPRNIVMRLNSNPPYGFSIDRLKMNIGPLSISAHDNEVSIIGPNIRMVYKNCEVDYARVGLVFYELR